MHNKRAWVQNITVANTVYWLVWSLWLCGLVASIAGFAGVFVPKLVLLLILPGASLLLVVFIIASQIKKLSAVEKLIIFFLSIAWLLHLVQVFVPETGFDALWYHLPVAELVLLNQRFTYDPNLYQSLNPLFSDAVFFLGFIWQRELGAKLVAYVFAVALVLMTYALARMKLPRSWALVAVFVISTFQVVTWQASSFYIDLAKALWELAAVVYVLKDAGGVSAPPKAGRSLLAAGLMLGAALTSKTFSILLLPVFALMIFWKYVPQLLSFGDISKFLRSLQMVGKARIIRSLLRNLALLFLPALAVVLPYYLFAYKHVGSPLGFVDRHVDSLIIGDSPSALTYFATRTLALPQLPLQMFLARDYLSPLLILIFPLAVLCRSAIAKNQQLQILLGFATAQLLVWWYLPPLSTRYALSGFVVMAVLVLYFIKMLAKQWQIQEQRVLFGIIGISIIMLSPRLFVLKRSLQYLTGQQTQSEYVRQFLDGNIDHVIFGWYGKEFEGK